jgi:hypothetical protein
MAYYTVKKPKMFMFFTFSIFFIRLILTDVACRRAVYYAMYFFLPSKKSIDELDERERCHLRINK